RCGSTGSAKMAHFLTATDNDLVAPAQILGHEPLNSAARYTKRLQDQMADAAERLTYCSVRGPDSATSGRAGYEHKRPQRDPNGPGQVPPCRSITVRTVTGCYPPGLPPTKLSWRARSAAIERRSKQAYGRSDKVSSAHSQRRGSAPGR